MDNIVPRIIKYWHCKTCHDSKDKDIECQSGFLAVGWTPEGIQAYCERCNLSVQDLDFEGHKVKDFIREVEDKK